MDLVLTVRMSEGLSANMTTLTDVESVLRAQILDYVNAVL